MSVVAAAIIGGAVVGGVTSVVTGKQASKAASKGADTAAQASIQTTEMQVDEIRRQFDYQAQVLYPRLQQQYAAAGAFGDLLGIGQNNQPGTSSYNPRSQGTVYASSGTPTAASSRSAGTGSWRRENAATRGQPGGSGRVFDNEGREIDVNQSGLVPPNMQAEFEASGMTAFDFAASQGLIPDDYRGGASTGQYEVAPGNQLMQPPVPGAPPPGSYNPNRNERGAFIDPNVDPLSLEGSQRLEGQVANTLLAGTPFEEDIYGQHVAGDQLRDDVGNRMLFDSSGPSRRMEWAEGNQIFGDTFEEGPGYQFQMEEMQREQDRRHSAGGGTMSPRAMLELSKRTAGIANQDFYNWAEGRGRDLSRTERAFDEDFTRERTDAARLDQAGQFDISRGDRSMENYLGRRAGDASRMDSAVAETDRLRGVDLQRRDTGYQNYLANLRAASGFGDVSAQVVQASQAAGGAVSGAYGNMGNTVAGIRAGEGATQAQIATNTGTNVNNAITSGMNNWAFYNAMQP